MSTELPKVVFQDNYLDLLDVMSTSEIFLLTCQISCLLVELICCYLYGIKWTRMDKNAFLKIIFY